MSDTHHEPCAETVVVSRAALMDLIEDVEAIARLTQNMVYCRLMQKVRAVKDTIEGGEGA